MTDETNLIPADPELTPEMLMEAGDALSKSLLFTLGRDYLDGPIFENDYVRMSGDEEIPQQPDLAILELEQVGKPVTEDMSEYLKCGYGVRNLLFSPFFTRAELDFETENCRLMN